MDNRKWDGWAIMTNEDEVHRFTLADPSGTDTLRGLQSLGWYVVPVTISERPNRPQATERGK